MAFVSQERKAELAPRIKQVLKKYGLTGSISVRNYSTLVVTISKGPIDFIGNSNEVYKEQNGVEYPYDEQYIQVNEFHIERTYSGIAREALLELKEAMTVGNWNNSDIYTDYFDVGWYIDINVGKWNKPYQLAA